MFGDASDARVRVKICGITDEVDARAAIECGADALGFNLYRHSSRYIDIDRERTWLAHLPADICKVAVMVNPTAEEAVAVAALPFIDLLQLHGNESPQFCRRLSEAGIQFAKAIPARNKEALAELGSFHTSIFVLDSVADGKFGGTGQGFPWSIAAQFVATHPYLRVILAGGLTPENVLHAVARVGPFAVDVTTGVERSKGKKDHARMRAFIEAVRVSKS
jgi:phosphoribosylanthranilate isomerase